MGFVFSPLLLRVVLAAGGCELHVGRRESGAAVKANRLPALRPPPHGRTPHATATPVALPHCQPTTLPSPPHPPSSTADQQPGRGRGAHQGLPPLLHAPAPAAAAHLRPRARARAPRRPRRPQDHRVDQHRGDVADHRRHRVRDRPRLCQAEGASSRAAAALLPRCCASAAGGSGARAAAHWRGAGRPPAARRLARAHSPAAWPTPALLNHPPRSHPPRPLTCARCTTRASASSRCWCRPSPVPPRTSARAAPAAPSRVRRRRWGALRAGLGCGRGPRGALCRACCWLCWRRELARVAPLSLIPRRHHNRRQVLPAVHRGQLLQGPAGADVPRDPALQPGLRGAAAQEAGHRRPGGCWRVAVCWRVLAEDPQPPNCSSRADVLERRSPAPLHAAHTRARRDYKTFLVLNCRSRQGRHENTHRI